MKYAIKILTVLIGLVMTVAARNGGSSQSQEVKFDGLGVKLAGTLVVPRLEAGKRAPAVLIIAGSGQTPRAGLADGAAQQTIYRDLAEALAAVGYASLRYDNRCAGSSECKKAESFDDYIDDAKGALEFLRKQERIDAKRVFLFGHGEGGVIASTIGASDEQGLAGVTLAASPGRTLSKLMRERIQNRMTEAGKKPEEIKAYLARYDRVILGLTNGRVSFSNEKLDGKDPYDALLLGLIDRYEVVVSLLINDPLQIAANIKSPVLILQGTKDTQVDVKDARYLEESLKRVSHPDATMQLLEDVDHLLKTNKGAATSPSSADASRPLDATMLTTLTSWMRKKMK